MKLLTGTTSFQLGNFSIEGPAILVIPGLLLLAAAFIASLYWLYKDAEKRGKNKIIAIILIIITMASWPLSFIWWFWLRPPVKNTE